MNFSNTCRTLSSLLLSLGALTACGSSTEYMAMNVPPHPVKERPISEVEMFTTAKPTRAFVEIGLISSRKNGDGRFSSTTEFELLQNVRTEAAKRGCDAVVVTGENKMAAGGFDGLGSYGAVESAHGFRATCIVYRD